MEMMQYQLTEGAGIGPCMDAKPHGGYVYAIEKKNENHRHRTRTAGRLQRNGKRRGCC